MGYYSVSSKNMKLSRNVEGTRANRIAYKLSADKPEGGKVISNIILKKYFGRTFTKRILLKLRAIRSVYEHFNEPSNYTNFT